MRRLSILDLLVVAGLFALHFALVRLCIDMHDSGLTPLALVLPLPLTVLAQRRFKLTWKTATILHYPIGIAWAFCFGLTCSMYTTRIPRDWYEPGTSDMHLNMPIQFGISSALVMGVVGIFTAAFYAFCSHYLHARTSHPAS